MQKLLECKAQLARIRILPQEVLGYVFLFYMDEPSHSPWTLMAVTRTWRATALSTRAIWAKIMITSPAWQKCGAFRRKDGRELCGTIVQLDRALRRAGNGALDIALSFTNPHGSVTRQYDKKSMWEMICFLGSSRKCKQVHNLEMHGSNAYYMRFLDGFDPLEFPSLKTLTVSTSYCSKFVAAISKTSKQITQVQVVAPRFYDHETPIDSGIEGFIKYPTMNSLALDGREVRHLSGRNLQVLVDALDQAHFITSLELTQLYLASSQHPIPAVRLPNLRTLLLRKSTKSWAFDAPRLTNLTLLDGSYILGGPPGSNNFPLLTSLTISAVAAWGRTDYLISMSFPPLHTLDICYGDRSDALKELMARRSELNPVVFRLRRTIVSTESLTEWISSMDRLEELYLEGVSLKKQFFKFLASSEAHSQNTNEFLVGETRLQCPLLVKLLVDIKGGSLAQTRNLKTEAKKAATIRAKAGVPSELWLIRSAGN